MADKSKIPIVILEPDHSLIKGNTTPKGSITITAPKKKKPGLGPKSTLGPQAIKGIKKALRGVGRAYGKNS